METQACPYKRMQIKKPMVCINYTLISSLPINKPYILCTQLHLILVYNSTNFASTTQCALRNFEAMMLLLLNWA